MAASQRSNDCEFGGNAKLAGIFRSILDRHFADNPPSVVAHGYADDAIVSCKAIRLFGVKGAQPRLLAACRIVYVLRSR
jgi:hypothetical protein